MTHARPKNTRLTHQLPLLAAVSCGLLSALACSSRSAQQSPQVERGSVGEATDPAAVDKPQLPDRKDAGAKPVADDGGAPMPDAGSRPRPDAGGHPRSDAGATAPQKRKAPADPGAQNSAPCQQLRAAGDGPRTLQSGGLVREYLLSLPEVGDEPLPLVIDLHGLLTHAAFQRDRSGWAAVAQSEHFAVAFPQALDAAWNLDTDSCCSADTLVDDIGFVRALVDDIAASGCIDKRSVYAVGSDVGGGLAQQLACKAADVFAAVASRDFDLLQNGSAACAPSRAISVFAVRDPADSALPYKGGELRPANGLPVSIRALGAEASLARWAELSGCSNTAEPAADGCQVRGGCRDGVAVALCEPASASPAKQWEFLRRYQLP